LSVVEHNEARERGTFWAKRAERCARLSVFIMQKFVEIYLSLSKMSAKTVSVYIVDL
jgi:hypothetical protein